ncbi:hypothetical protein BDW69DRAFT_190409 [Aspergillus filifer]
MALSLVDQRQSISPQSEHPNELDPYRFLEERTETRTSFRECHSIPNSLPPSFPRADLEESIKDPPRKKSKQHSKSVRFDLGQRMVQYFNPTETPDSVQKKIVLVRSPEDDAYVREHLEPSYREAKGNLLDNWIDTAEGEGALALILLLDQVPRNIFRGTPQAYATDEKAVTVARYAVDKGWHRRLPAVQQRYLYGGVHQKSSPR